MMKHDVDQTAMLSIFQDFVNLIFSPGLDMFRHVTSLFMRPATTFLPRPWYLEDAVEPPSGLAAGQPAPIQV